MLCVHAQQHACIHDHMNVYSRAHYSHFPSFSVSPLPLLFFIFLLLGVCVLIFFIITLSLFSLSVQLSANGATGICDRGAGIW